MAKRQHTDDLFELFPDLPWSRHYGSNEERVRALQRQVDATRERARVNIERQRRAAERVRAALSARRH